MAERRWYWPWGDPPPELTPTEPSTLPEAEKALEQSRAERAMAARLRPRVDRAVRDLAREREVNHMAERFRSALKGAS